MRHQPMKPGAGTERVLQKRYLAVANAMRGVRPQYTSTALSWEKQLDTWRDCVEALCYAYASTDEDFNADVFRHNCNW